MPTDSMRRLLDVLHLSVTLRAVTGLRIGANDSSISIGGNDNPVIRHPVSGQPYVPGSSLKGKMRSLLERVHGLEQNFPIDRPRVMIHACQREADYAACVHCQLFGAPAPGERWFCQTRLRVADLFLSADAVGRLREANTDLPFTEVKSEAAIDRVTSAAVPRSMERVPAGADFGPARLAVFRYEGDDARTHLDYLVQGMELLEADYLGGAGSRGSGRVEFSALSLAALRFPAEGAGSQEAFQGGFPDVGALRQRLDEVAAWLSRPA